MEIYSNSMYIYDILMNLIESIRNLFQNESSTNNSTRELTEHQQNRIQGLREDIEKLQKGNDLNIRKMYQEASKINRNINSQTDYVIIIKFIENELKYLTIFKDLDPQTDIAVEFIEKNTKLLDLKDKFNILLIIKEKEDKIKRISYLP